MGNIATVKKNNVLVAKYTYDGLNRLVREDNQELNGTYLYTYDGNGNILSKETFAYTTGSVTSGIGTVQSYFYNNRDQLQSYNGQTFAYDAVGNPTTYKGQALTWNRGRKLVNFNGTTFTYDAQGKRIRKNSTNYYYNSAGQLLKSSDGMEYFYGNNGVMGFVYSGNKYVYRKNLQGDVIEILDSNGNSVVQYVYDAWGSCTVSTTSNQTLAQINPFRYRGYFYDVETGLYFLKTRYYDPTIGRFINIDSINYVDTESINGLNLYAYCGNNPVMDIDPNGTWSWEKVWKTVAVAAVAVVAVAAIAAITVATGGTATPIIVGATVGALISGGTSVAVQYATTGSVDFAQVVVDASFGMVMSAFGGSNIGQIGMTIAGATTGFMGSLANDFVSGGDINWGAAIASSVTSGFFGYLSGGGAQSNNATLKNKMSKLQSRKSAGKPIRALRAEIANEKNLLRAKALKEVFFSIDHLYTFAVEYPILSMLKIIFG